MEKILEKLRKTRVLAAIGVASLILGTMFTYVKYSFWGYNYSISLWGYWEGKVVLFLAVANLLLIFKDYVEKYVPGLFKTDWGQKIMEIRNPRASLIPTFLSVAFTFYLHTTLHIEIDEYTKYGLGFYLLWIGAICLVAYAFLRKNATTNEVFNEKQNEEIKNEENNN